ncbi:MAG: ATP-binding protein [Planctomycetes bacterium]|nr:ATP-binding protein [Planctomycetota bacterium]
MVSETQYPRLSEATLHESLSDSPAVLIHGPRQCGKTTLAKAISATSGHAYFTLDDEAVRNAALSDPVGFVASLPERVVLEEVQHVPHLFSSLKVAIDRNRVAGRFLLTGSANILLLPKLAESLAGRMAIHRLHPLSECELERSDGSFLDKLFEGSFRMQSWPRLGDALILRIVRGGYPAAVKLPEGRRRSRWYRDYADAVIQRDVRHLKEIATVDVLERLLLTAASQTARLVNFTDLAAPFQQSRPTIRSYVDLLARLFLLEELPPWHVNRMSRLIKTSKLHMGDTGLTSALLGLNAAALQSDRNLLGQLLETFVVQELRRQASWSKVDAHFYHFRDRDNYEVDVVLEGNGREIVGVETKASATITAADFRGLRKLKAMAGKRFACGVVLYDGEMSLRFDESLFAIPVRALWEAPG